MNALLNRTNVASKSLMSFTKAKLSIQPKLTINTPGDIYEQEADAIADRVMRMSVNETMQQPKPITGLIGRSVQRKCTQCQEEEKKKPIMRKAENGNPGMQVSSSFASTLNASKGSGSPLPQGINSFMENAFSTDFSAVRVHTDNQASEMSKGINANAFTYGSDIYFTEGQYNTDSSEGKHLLAHELTHTIQQKEYSSLQPMIIHRDLAIEPTVPNVVGRVLTPAQMRRAIRWNQAGFEDVAEIGLLRDVLGRSTEPAVIDEDFINALVQYQANYGLTQDGLLGAGTALRLANELQAEANRPGVDPDVGTGTNMALNPAQRRMRLRSRVVSRLGRILHQGFVGPRENPRGIVTARSRENIAALFPGVGVPLDNAISFDYTGSNANDAHWLQFAFTQISFVNPVTRRRVFHTGSIFANGVTHNFSNGTTFNWMVDSNDAVNPFYEARYLDIRNPGANTEIFDQPQGFHGLAETFAAAQATRPARVRIIIGFDTYLIVNDRAQYRVRWNKYFNFNTSTTPTPATEGPYEVLIAGSASVLPRNLKTVLNTKYAGSPIR